MPVDRSADSLSLPESFTQTGEQEVPVQWWQEFDDPQLNRLVEEALTKQFHHTFCPGTYGANGSTG